jgi:hypothetical protein
MAFNQYQSIDNLSFWYVKFFQGQFSPLQRSDTKTRLTTQYMWLFSKMADFRAINLRSEIVQNYILNNFYRSIFQQN